MGGVDAGFGPIARLRGWTCELLSQSDCYTRRKTVCTLSMFELASARISNCDWGKTGLGVDGASWKLALNRKF